MPAEGLLLVIVSNCYTKLSNLTLAHYNMGPYTPPPSAQRPPPIGAPIYTHQRLPRIKELLRVNTPTASSQSANFSWSATPLTQQQPLPQLHDPQWRDEVVDQGVNRAVVDLTGSQYTAPPQSQEPQQSQQSQQPQYTPQELRHVNKARRARLSRHNELIVIGICLDHRHAMRERGVVRFFELIKDKAEARLRKTVPDIGDWMRGQIVHQLRQRKNQAYETGAVQQDTAYLQLLDSFI